MIKTTSSFTWDYSPSPESTDHINIDSRYGLFINGKFVPPLSKKYFKTHNPATGESLAEIAQAGEKDVHAAVSAAQKTYQNVWKKMPGKERAKYIFRIARVIQER